MRPSGVSRAKGGNNVFNPTPTRRAVLDIGRICNLRCKFCYFRHSDLKGHEPISILKSRAAAAIGRGNDTIELTGGEPTMLPFVEEFISNLKDMGVRTSIITNGVVPSKKAISIISAGIDEFFISLHGQEKTHDEIVGLDGARKKQLVFLSFLIQRAIPFYFNFVITRHTSEDIPYITELALRWRPRILNFVNFNPQQGWSDDPEGVRDTVADLIAVGPELDRAIEALEAAGIGVNLRFYPMCCISEQSRKNVCNNLHVSFDPYEWDYQITPKTLEAHLRWARMVSRLNENKKEPCNRCDLQNICGGINIHFHRATDGKMAHPVALGPEGDRNDFYFYRKHCVLSLSQF